MCGRMVLTRSAGEIAAAFEAEGLQAFEPRYNIAPSQDVVVVRQTTDRARRISLLHWGLIPSWAKARNVGARMINARSETAAEKPAFRTALRRRRCIVPADGFYEWGALSEGRAGEGEKSTRVPHFFRRPDGALLALAGLWEEWADPQTGELVESCTLLTTEANAAVRPVHHRMPVLLARPDHGLWLDPGETDAASVLGLLVPASPDELEGIEVSTLVNNPGNDEPACIAPV
jgi:putative SOS response-associated peptidase YedK